MGGKNQNAANSSWTEVSKKGGDAPKKNNKAQKCKKGPKHWIGVRVEDEDGNLVKDVTVHAKLEDAEYSLDMATAALDKEGVSKTKKIFDATEIEFSFPDLYDVDWWPKGAAKPTSFPAEQTINIEDGGCVVSLAATAEFRDYHEVWDCAANSNVKQTCPNPNQQVPGGAYQGPSTKTKTEKKAMDQTWTFVIRNKKPAKIRIVLIDKEDKPLKDKDWEFTKLAKTGKTGANGMIEVIDLKLLKLKADKLKVTMKPAVTPPTPPPVTPAPVPDIPPYPPAIVPADFKDKIPAPDNTAKVVNWDFQVGALTAFNVQKGVLERLQNLGFHCDADPGTNPTAEGEPEAIEAYLRLYQPKMDPAGKTWTDIKDDIRDRHDKA